MIPITLYRTLRPGRKPRACGDDPDIDSFPFDITL